MNPELLTQSTSAYRKDGRIILLSHSQSRDRSYQSEDFSVRSYIELNETEDLSLIGEKLLEAFSKSILMEKKPSEEELFSFEAMMYSEFQLRDWEELARRVDQCRINFLNNQYQFIPIAGSWVRDDKIISLSDNMETAQLGKALLQALELSRDINPFLVKYSNPSAGIYPDELAPEVIREIERLEGAQRAGFDISQDMVVEQFLAPKAIQRFFSYQFPHVYCSSENEYRTYSVRAVELFEKLSYLDPENPVIADRRNRFLAYFALGEKSYFLAFDLNDQNPSDPAVFKIDHFDPEQRIYGGFPLSLFLSDLIVDTSVNKKRQRNSKS